MASFLMLEKPPSTPRKQTCYLGSNGFLRRRALWGSTKGSPPRSPNQCSQRLCCSQRSSKLKLLLDDFCPKTSERQLNKIKAFTSSSWVVCNSIFLKKLFCWLFDALYPSLYAPKETTNICLIGPNGDDYHYRSRVNLAGQCCTG